MFVTPAYAETAPAAGEVHTETGVAHEAGHETGVFPPFDHTTFPSQLLWLAITFGLFYLLMQKVIVPQIGGILENRHDRIAQDLDEAARLKGDADAAIATYEKELADAKAKAGAIASKARDEAQAKADAERSALEASLAEKLAAAEASIAEIKAKAFNDVGTIAAETAATIVDELIGVSGNQADATAAVAGLSMGKGA
jgi:F-type H+-transporting ATPase subunit b